MKEFWLWIVVVTLMIVCIMGLSFVGMHTQKQVRKAEVILMRLEEKERKSKADEAINTKKESTNERAASPLVE